MGKYVIAQCPICGNEYTSLYGERRPVCPVCGNDADGTNVSKSPVTDEIGRALIEADDLLYSRKFDKARELYTYALTLGEDAHALICVALAEFKVEFDEDGAPVDKAKNRGRIREHVGFMRANELAIGLRRASIEILGEKIDGLHVFTEAQNKDLFNRGFRIVGTRLESFYGRAATVAVPDGITEIAALAFVCASDIKSVHIPSSVEAIDSFAFDRRITEITVDPDNKVFVAKSGCLIDKRTKTLVTCFSGASIPTDGSVEIIGKRAIQDRKDLERFTVPKGVTAIEESAFDCCTNLKLLSLPYTLVSVGAAALSNCDKLNKVAVDAPNTHIRFESGCLIDNASGILLLAAVGCKIPDDVKTVGRAAFGSGHTSLHFPASVDSGIEQGFCGCNALEKLTVAEDNPVYRSENNCIIDRKTGAIVRGCRTSIIPTDGSVTAIGDSAFRDCFGIQKLVIPDGIESIGVCAFDCLPDLTELVLSDSVKSIESYAFDFCTRLEKIDLGNGLEYIGNNAFDACNSLKSVTIPASVTHIEAGAFSDCEILTEVILEDKTGWRVNGVEVNPDNLDGSYTAELVTDYADLTKDTDPKS